MNAAAELNADGDFPSLTSHAPQLSVPDYMVPMITESTELSDLDLVLEEVRTILQGEELAPQPIIGGDRVVAEPPWLPQIPLFAFDVQGEVGVESSALGDAGVPGHTPPLRFFQVYGSESSMVVLIDFWNNVVEEDEKSAEYLRVIDVLRASGREIPAAKVTAKLQSGEGDPDRAGVKLYSLQEMARFLLRHKGYASPIVGTDPHGIVQVEWRFDGNGLLVVAFLGDGQVHCVALSDATATREEMNESVQLSTDAAVETFGELIPEK